MSDRNGVLWVDNPGLTCRLPDPLQTKLQPVFQRIPEDPQTTRVSVAERFQNVLQILNEAAKAQNEITVNVEVYAERNPANLQVVKVTEANLTYVAIDRDGKPRQIPGS